MKFYLTLLLFVSGMTSQAQNWNKFFKESAFDRKFNSHYNRAGGSFGYSVSISGDYAIVGAYL